MEPRYAPIPVADDPNRDGRVSYPTHHQHQGDRMTKAQDPQFGGRAAGAGKRTGSWMTVEDFCRELQISRSTWNDWRAKGRAPACVRLPNGSLRIRRVAFENWLSVLEGECA